MLHSDTFTRLPICAAHIVSVIADETDFPIAIPTPSSQAPNEVKSIPVVTATSTGTSKSPLTTTEGGFNVTEMHCCVEEAYSHHHSIVMPHTYNHYMYCSVNLKLMS